jgi:hypothetical protein
LGWVWLQHCQVGQNIGVNLKINEVECPEEGSAGKECSVKMERNFMVHAFWTTTLLVHVVYVVPGVPGKE